MLKKEFIKNVTSVVNGSKNVFKGDIPAIRELFCAMLDNYSKDGLITDIQANNWILTNSELNKLIKITKQGL